MLRIRFIVFAALAAVLAFGTSAAHASSVPPTSDPGFTFVDVDGDGLYSPGTDIGLKSTHSVDIDALISSDGQFDTQANKGPYRAPCRPVSLVVPASVSLAPSSALNLRAGQNIIVHGSLTASAICLQACGNLDLTKAYCTFVSQLNACAGCNATISGMTATGDPFTGQICINACRNVVANMTSDGSPTSFFTGACIGIQAGCNLCMDSAFLTATADDAYVYGCAGGVAAISNSAFTASNGTVAAGSRCGATQLSADQWVADCAYICSGGSATLDGSDIRTSGPISIQACGTVTGKSVINGQSLCVSGSCGVDLSNSNLLILGGSAAIASDCGSVCLVNAPFKADGGISVHARGNIDFSGASLSANHFYTFCSDCGGITAVNSAIAPFGAATDTAISLAAPGRIRVAGSQWTTPANICIVSRCSAVDVSNTILSVTGSNAQIQIAAYGGPITATGATFSTAPMFGPNHVAVVGYSH